MQELLMIFVLSLTAVLSYPSSEWQMVPDADGRLHLMNVKQMEYEKSMKPRIKTVVKFLLFTPENPTSPQQLYQDDADGLKRSNFKSNRPTRFVIHSFLNDGNSEVNVLIRKAYLERGSYNVIVVDWSTATATINYMYARREVPVAGEQCGRFIDFLNTQGTSLNDIYCIGHSLGAHVCGFCGKNTKRGQINTIFAMDPTYSLFDINKPNERLNENDAKYVQSIQTDAGRIGFPDPIGNASFYPASGGVQPGCLIDFTGLCSHLRSYKYFAESLKVKDSFIGERCGDIAQIKKKKCVRTGTSPMGGDPSNSGITGIYNVPVNSKSPYAKGNVF